MKLNDRWTGPQSMLLGLPARVALAANSSYGVDANGRWTGPKHAKVGVKKRTNQDSICPPELLGPKDKGLAKLDAIAEASQAKFKAEGPQVTRNQDLGGMTEVPESRLDAFQRRSRSKSFTNQATPQVQPDRRVYFTGRLMVVRVRLSK